MTRPHVGALAWVIFEDADWEVREAAVQALGTLGEHAAPHVGDIVDRLKREYCGWEAKYFVLGLLGALGEHAPPHVDAIAARELPREAEALRRFCLDLRRP